MEPTQSSTPLSTPPPIQNNSGSIFKSKKLLIILAAVLLLALGGLVFFFLPKSEEKPDTKNSEVQKEFEQKRQALENTNRGDATIIYATPTSNGYEIFAYDLGTTSEYKLTTLPQNVKKISVLSSSEIIYISGTNAQDYGQNLVIKNLQNNTEETIYSTSENFGIDDYILSPDKNQIATWEIQLSTQGILQGGRSRIQTFNISTLEDLTTITTQNITAQDPIFYPVLVNSTELYLDRFLPNSGAGWAYGMSVANITTGAITSLPQMQSGTYSTKPIASQTGSKIAFAGYDGSKGPGTEIENNFRKALIYANQLEVFDTETKTRTVLTNLPQNNTYLRLLWGNDTPNNLIYSAVNPTKQGVGEFTYSIPLTLSREIDSTTNLFALSELTNTSFLEGEVTETSQQAISNLGTNSIYQFSYEKLGIKDIKKNTFTEIPTSLSLIQYIDTIYPETQIESTTIQQASNKIIDFGELISGPGLNLQLRSLIFPTPKAEERKEQHNDPVPTTPPTVQPTQPPQPSDEPPPQVITFAPPATTPPPTTDERDCDDLSFPICLSQMGVSSYDQLQPGQAGTFRACRIELNMQFQAEGRCDICPLFIYGPEGKNVNVTINTNLSNSNIPHSQNTYNVTLDGQGNLNVQDKQVENISFNFKRSKNLTPPKYGSIVKTSNLELEIEKYGKNLGLTTREINKLTQEAKTLATDKYVFLTFFNQETSKFLLPITFNPKPDTYLSYIFYVKPLKTTQDLTYTPKTPTFPTIPQRGEFTAVEVTAITD